MSGQIKITGVSENVDGPVEATFELQRENLPTKRFTIPVPPTANQADIMALVSARLSSILAGEPSPAAIALNGMLAAQQTWPLPEPAAQQ